MPSARSVRSGGFSAFERLQRPAAAADPSAGEAATPTNGAAAGGGSPTKASARPPPPERELALAEVQRLLEDLRTAVVGLAFQKALDSVRSKDWGALKKRAGVAKLLSYAWKAPLKASGFAIDGHSFPRVLAAVRAHAAQPGIRSLSEEVERLLKFFPGALFGSKAGRMKGSATNQAMSQSQGGRGAFSKMSNGSNGRPEPAPAPSARPSMLRGRPMGLGEAKDILKRLKEDASKKAFQDGLAEIRRTGEAQAQKSASNFVARHWEEAMNFYEFPVTPAGFKEMADGIMRCAYNRHVEMLAHEVEEKLHVPLGSFFGIAAEGAEEGEDQPVAQSGGQAGSRPGAGEVTVLLRHNTEATELQVPVQEGATFWDVKEAAARILGRESMKTRGRLVRKSPGGTFVSFKDSDPIGGVREVLVLGAELTPENGHVPGRAPAAAITGKMRLSFEDMSPIIQPAPRQPEPGQVPVLTKQQARQLMVELHAGYKDVEFQRTLQRYHASLGATSQFRKERQRLALTVQVAVLPKYGFRANFDGAVDMQKVLDPLVRGDKEMEALAGEIEGLLMVSGKVKKKAKDDTVESQHKSKEKAQPEPEEPPKAPATDPEPEPPSRPESRKVVAPAKEVYFVIRHALHEKDEEIWLKAMSSSTFLQIRHKLADTLDREEVKTKARFVHKSSSAGVWTDFGDEEEIGRDRTVLHVLGIALPPKEITLTVRPALKDEDCYEAKISVWTNWKFREVREELAKRLGRPDVGKKAKFVFRPGGHNAQGAWAAFKDEEQVGNRAELKVLGVDDLEPTAEARKAMMEEAKQKTKAKEEERAALQADAAKKAKEEYESKSQAEAERKAKEKKERKMKLAAEAWKATQGVEDNAEPKGADAEASEATSAANAPESEDLKKARRESYISAKEEVERREREELERKAKQAQEEAALKAKQEAARQAKEEAERAKREEAELKAKEAERREREEQEEAERRKREEAERTAKEEAERRRSEEAERRAKEEAERRAKEVADAERKAREEAERREREEAERVAKEEAERRAKEDAERQEREEAAQRAKEAADKREREETERKAKEEAERIAVERMVKEEEERRAKAAQEEAERKAMAEAEIRKKEEAERKAIEEAERRKREEAEQKAREEKERREQEEAEKRAREEADRREREAKELAERKQREEAEHKAKQEEEERKAKEAERKAKEEAEKKAKAEADQKAKREAERKAKEEAERKTKEAEQKAKAAASSKIKKELAPAPPRLSQLEIVKMMRAQGAGVEDQPQHNEDARIWIVVGGEDKGGILVRKGEGYDSKPMPIRLATGARIEELEKVGNRLHYRRLVGDGPDFGWVNCMLNEKVLVEEYELKDLYPTRSF